MPRFHFHVQDGASSPDDDGTVLPDCATARVMAAKLAGALLYDQPEAIWESDDWRLNVTDARGLILFSLALMTADAPGVSRRASGLRTASG